MKKIDLEPVQSVRHRTHNILYVEDDNINWLVAQLVIGKEYQLTRAVNAQEALTLLHAQEFSLILMDIELANSTMDGIELTELLRGSEISTEMGGFLAAHREIPVVFVTAYSGLYSSAELLARGGSAMVTKPIDFPKLLGVVTSLLTEE